MYVTSHAHLHTSTTLVAIILNEMMCCYGVPSTVYNDQCAVPLFSLYVIFVERDQHDWDSQLPKTLFAYKTAIHESTSFSPFHLNFGYSPQLPIELMLS